MIHFNNWSKCYKKVKVIIIETRKKRWANKELCSSFRLSHICSNFTNYVFTFGFIKYELSESRNIIDSHVFKIKIPELFLLYSKINMSLRLDVASIISKPNIIACIWKHECYWILRCVDHPLRWWINYSMLKQHNWSSLCIIINRSWGYSMKF